MNQDTDDARDARHTTDGPTSTTNGPTSTTDEPNSAADGLPAATDEPTPALRTEGLSVTYADGDVEALDGVDVTFAENRLTAIVGPSGCGKSTLLKALNRLHAIGTNVTVEGEVYLDGEPLYATDEPLPAIRARVGYVPQEPTALPLSIYENVAFGPRIHGDPSRAELDALVEEYLRKADLWEEVRDRLDAPAADLSTGQLQRLSLARSLAVEPEVLLCDEVTSALDPVSAAEVERTLASLRDEYTIVAVTHSMDRAKRLADDVVFLYLGEVVETNDTRTFFEEPAHDRTRRFVGDGDAAEYSVEGATHGEDRAGSAGDPADGTAAADD